MTRLSKPIVIFLDNATVDERILIITKLRPMINGMDLERIILQPKLVVTNLNREGERIDAFVVRYSSIRPHFINRDCYKNALVYGQSNWVGDRYEYTFTVPQLQYDEQGNILPATVDWINSGYPGGLIIVEKDTNNIVLGDIEYE